MKIAIFYHIAQMGMGAFIYQQQLHRLYTSGLIEAADYIHFGVNGDNELFNVPDKVIVKQNQNWEEETETLLDLKNFSQKNLDYRILYFHTKGVSKGTLIANAWRLMMEYFVIDKWKECVNYMNDYDCVGSNLKILGPMSSTFCSVRSSFPNRKLGTKLGLGSSDDQCLIPLFFSAHLKVMKSWDIF